MEKSVERMKISSIKSVRNRNDSEKRYSRHNVKPEKINPSGCMFS